MTHHYIEYGFRRPPELDGEDGNSPVVILGGGPVGMACALSLANYGVASVVLEQSNRVADGSRAICISRRSLEILDSIGAGAPVSEKGLWWSTGVSYYGTRPVFRLQMPHGDEDKYPPFVNIQQYYLEEFLVEAIEAQPLIDLRWQNQGVGVERLADCVHVNVETPEGTYPIEAEYVIAADGAKSMAREALGLKLKGSGYEGRYLIADIILETDLPVERRAWFDPEWRPGGTVLMHAQPDHMLRIDYQLYRDENTQDELKEGRVRQRIQQHLDYIGMDQEWTLEWTSVYQAYALALDDYQCGRVFFAGDAAHLVPIFGVRGLNSGFEDAYNLCWKLAAVLENSAQERLLKSYSLERRAATLETFEAAKKSTYFMTPPSRGFMVMRSAVLSLSLAHEFVRPLFNPRQSAPIPYENSPLLMPGEQGNCGVQPGDCFPNVRVFVDGSAQYLLDVLGEGFAVLHFPSEDEVDPQIQEELDDFSKSTFPIHYAVVHAGDHKDCGPLLRLEDRSGALTELCSVPDGGAVVLRPDAHVLTRLHSFEGASVRAILETCLSGGWS